MNPSRTQSSIHNFTSILYQHISISNASIILNSMTDSYSFIGLPTALNFISSRFAKREISDNLFCMPLYPPSKMSNSLKIRPLQHTKPSDRLITANAIPPTVIPNSPLYLLFQPPISHSHPCPTASLLSLSLLPLPVPSNLPSLSLLLSIPLPLCRKSVSRSISSLPRRILYKRSHLQPQNMLHCHPALRRRVKECKKRP